MEHREHWFTAQDGLRLYCRDYGPITGSAMTVLCLSGLTRNSHDFSRLARIFGTNRRFICPDYRGRGKSEKDPNWRNYVPSIYINDIRHLLISLNIHQVFVIGSSMGGILAMAMGATMPTVLSGALINDIGPIIEREGMNKILSYVQDGLPTFDDWSKAIVFMRTEFPNLPAKTDEDWRWITEGTFQERENGRIGSNWDANIIRPLLKNKNEEELWPLFRSLRHLPLVVTRGEYSDILSEATLNAMSFEIPNLIAVTVEGTGHMPNLLEIECQEAINNVFAVADYTNHR